MIPSVVSLIFPGILSLLSQFWKPEGSGDGASCAGYLFGRDFKMNMLGKDEEEEIHAVQEAQLHLSLTASASQAQ